MATLPSSNGFDPTSIGAVPIAASAAPSNAAASPNASFDPTSIGAVPVTPGQNTFSDSNSQLGQGITGGSILRTLANAGSGIEQKFVSVAATPVQLLAKAVGA